VSSEVDLLAEATITVLSAGGFASFSLADACPGDTLDWCSRASVDRSARRIVRLSSLSDKFLTIDTGAQRSVEVRVDLRRISSVAVLGQPCSALVDGAGCGDGLTCEFPPGEATGVCVTELPQPQGPGGVCVSESDCLPGLTCDGTCQAFEESTCASELDLFDLDAAEGAVLTLVPSTGTPAGACGGLPRAAVLQVSSTRQELLIVSVRSAAGLPVAISQRDTCSQLSSEQGCILSSGSDSATLSFFPSSLDTAVAIVEGYGDVEVSVQRVPLISRGGTCDSTGETNRCQPGLDCVRGVCGDAVAGSCSDPAPGFLAGTGELTGRGFVIDAALETVDALEAPGCSGTRRTQVFALQMPASGELSAELADPSVSASVALVRDCRLVAEGTLCPQTGGSRVSADVSSGERMLLLVSSQSLNEVSVVVRLEVSLPEGSACTSSLECRGGLECRGAVCRRRPVDANALCDLVFDECPTGLICAPIGGELRCRSSIATIDQECGGLSGLPTCEVGLSCVASEGSVSFCRASGGELGDACSTASPCNARLTCLSSVCWPSPAAEGGVCEPDSPQPCQSGLECRTGGGTSVCVPEGVTPCSDASPCGVGQVCVSNACEVPLSEGEVCTVGTGIPCAAGLDCTAGDGGSTCVRALLGPGDSCSVSADCQVGLFCQPLGGTSARQCAARRAAGQVCQFGGPEDQCVDGLSCAFDLSFTPRCQ
jgi:hypothetical protein